MNYTRLPIPSNKSHPSTSEEKNPRLDRDLLADDINTEGVGIAAARVVNAVDMP